ncbi:hypothetical protein BGZ63DRAFT_140518 [Mariannaea sp. PMI_226]|nr:hypothetical protein BGZ63DRAFT_140518 [Mariannaea sp. PMI_226]
MGLAHKSTTKKSAPGTIRSGMTSAVILLWLRLVRTGVVPLMWLFLPVCAVPSYPCVSPSLYSICPKGVLCSIDRRIGFENHTQPNKTAKNFKVPEKDPKRVCGGMVSLYKVHQHPSREGGGPRRIQILFVRARRSRTEHFAPKMLRGLRTPSNNCRAIGCSSLYGIMMAMHQAHKEKCLDISRAGVAVLEALPRSYGSNC